MVEIPQSVENYINSGKKVSDASEIYNDILLWLDLEKNNYYLTIEKYTKLCDYLLYQIDNNKQIQSHLNYISPDILSIIYEKSSKHLKFPDSCYCRVDNPFIGINHYSSECLFWDSFRKLSIKVASKCSPKEGYVIFVEIIIGTVSLPVNLNSDKNNLKNNDFKKENNNSNLNSLSIFHNISELPRFYRYLGLHCSLICISRMKRNKAQFITTVCSLALRKFIYDIECNSLYMCSSNNFSNEDSSYCIVALIKFLEYLIDEIIELLLDCLTECKCDAEYKNQEVGLFNPVSSESNVNVTQHAIYSFLMKTLEKLILIDIHDIQIIKNVKSEISDEKKIVKNVLLSDVSSSIAFNSIINLISSETHLSNHQFDQKTTTLTELMYKICYNINLVAPRMTMDILSHMPICIYDVESQQGDLDVTSLSLACYSYVLFVILENSFPNEINNIYPKFIISLPFKLNIIYRTVSIFLTYSDNYKYGYEIDFKKKSNDILLSYFNTYITKNIINNNKLILKFQNLIYNRLQDKAYYLLESNFQNFVKCKELMPDSFKTIFGLDWHQNILIKQIMFSFTRNRDDISVIHNLNVDQEIYFNQNIYSHLFENLTISLSKCYSYQQLFNIYFNIIEFQKNLFLFNNLHSVNIIIGLMSKICNVWWEEVNFEDHNINILKSDLKKIILFCTNYLKDFSVIDDGLTQSDVLSLIILNLMKLILLSYLNNQRESLKIIFEFLIYESKILESYLNLIKSFEDNIEIKKKTTDLVLFVVNDIEDILNKFKS